MNKTMLYATPQSEIIYFLESDLITISSGSEQKPDIGEWDGEM